MGTRDSGTLPDGEALIAACGAGAANWDEIARQRGWDAGIASDELGCRGPASERGLERPSTVGLPDKAPLGRSLIPPARRQRDILSGRRNRRGSARGAPCDAVVIVAAQTLG
jgi:hypothetical protein